jgi:hypothetical protein
MGYYHPVSGKQGKMADMYGVKGVNHSNRPGAYAKPGNENRTSSEVERDIRGAMMDDYSTREFLKYNEDIREEANEIKNLRKQNNFIHDSMKKAHKNDGNGGKYSSDADRGGVAQSAFDDYMKNLKAGLKGAGTKKPEPEQTPNKPRDEYAITEEDARIKQREQDTFSGRDTSEMYDSDFKPDTPGQTFLDRYKMNFMPSKKGKDPAMVNRGLA